MKILVIGSGGREHTIGWKIKQNPQVNEIFFAPGNAGTQAIGKNIPINANQINELVDFAKENNIDLTLVGPEDPLTQGIVDLFQEKGLRIFGPNKEGAQIEGSKVFFKKLMIENNIPTADYKEFSNAEDAITFVKQNDKPWVVKADGLAAGKGVILCNNAEETINAIKIIMQDKKFGDAGNKIVIEEFLKGEEASIIAFTDGKTIKTLTPSQDHKAAYDGDKGPNTGGMGAYAPAPVITPELLEQIKQTILKPTIEGLAKKGINYKGILYAGLMMTKDGPKILEYNARLGDPETEVILPLMESDLVNVANACIDGTLADTAVNVKQECACCVIMASGGYPDSYEKGKEITGLHTPHNDDVIIFQAGTKQENEKTITSGGRVLGITALAPTLKEAIEKAYKTVDKIKFDQVFYRKDIGHKALARWE